jgi:hypothetical protein
VKKVLIHVGMLVCILWSSNVALAADLSETPQRVAGRGFEAWLQKDGLVCVGIKPSVAPEAPAAPCTLVGGLTEIVQIEALGPHLLARQTDGRVWTWQPNGLLRPRPIQGLHGRVTEMGSGADGDLWLSVQVHSPGTAAGASVAGSTTVRLVSVARAGQVELMRVPLSSRSAMARARGVE